MFQIASVANNPSMRQVLQDVQRTTPEASNKTVINWLVSAAHLVLENPRNLQEQVTKWTTYLDLMTVLREMGMWQVMFILQYHGRDKELKAHMKDMVLVSRPDAMFRSVAALRAPFTDCLIHDAMGDLAKLGDVEVKPR